MSQDFAELAARARQNWSAEDHRVHEAASLAFQQALAREPQPNPGFADLLSRLPAWDSADDAPTCTPDSC